MAPARPPPPKVRPRGWALGNVGLIKVSHGSGNGGKRFRWAWTK